MPVALLASAEPMLADLPGRATAAQVEAIVDRWVLGRALELHAGNVTHAAAWLKISRRQLRLRWAKVRALPATRSSMSGPPRGPAPPSLSDLLERSDLGGRAPPLAAEQHDEQSACCGRIQ